MNDLQNLSVSNLFFGVFQIGFTQMMSLSIPFFGYNAVKEDSESDVNAKLDFNKKLEEADQLFLEDKYEDVVNVLDEYKV